MWINYYKTALFITLLQQIIHPSAFWPEPVALLTVYQVTAVTYTVEAERKLKQEES